MPVSRRKMGEELENSTNAIRMASNFFDDFAATLNMSEECLTEFAFADTGSSAFNRALYAEKVTPSLLEELSLRPCNIAFLANCNRRQINAPLNKIVFRQAKNESILIKSIISFDLDFKDVDKRFLSMPENEKFNFAISISGKIIEESQKSSIPIWVINYSGNGLHLHFRLKMPIKVPIPSEYQARYRNWLSILSVALGGGFSFDASCSNAARLMRLPLSTNWKDQNSPLKNVIFLHNPHADASEFFQNKIDHCPHQNPPNKLKFIQILNHFNYQKMDSMKQKGDQIICSSPFTNDSSPSFYFHPEKKIFYDFSTGRGGGLHRLIADLSDLEQTENPHDIEKKIAEILDEKENDAASERYSLRGDGVWFNKQMDDDSSGLWVCSPLAVDAMTRSHLGESWGRALSFLDQDGTKKIWAMPMDMLAGDGLELRKELLRRGLRISQNRKARHHLMEYIQSFQTNIRVRCIDRIGWHDNAYVLPKQTFYKTGTTDPIVLQKEGDFDCFQTKGTLEEWQAKIATPCIGNSRLIFSLSTAFAPPLLYLLGEESGGIHFVGPSSIGKTLALRIAASVWGGGGVAGFVKKWRSTVNGLETLAESRCDSLLVLDEIAEIPPRDAAMATYMLANGVGKKRMTKDGGAKTTAEWRIIFLSSGEIGLATHLAGSGEEHRGGQFVRLVEIEADAQCGLGIFNHIGAYANPTLLADELRQNCTQFYGTPIAAFLSKLVKLEDPQAALDQSIKQFTSSLDPILKSGQVARVAKRFGIIGAAGVLAAKMKILPFAEEEILESVKLCFKNWASMHQDFPDFETEKILSQIRQYLQFNGCANFPEWDGKSQLSFNGKCCGYRLINLDGSIEWLILNEVFRNEICNGLDFRRVTRILKEFNLIKSDRNNKSSIPMRLPNFGLVRVYHLTSEIFEYRKTPE